jgi:flavin-dependent dehydrogenase
MGAIMITSALNSIPESPQALVIGAGPTGSGAASVLARAGLSTVLVERASFPRRKVCGGCLAPAGIRALHACGLGDRLNSIDPIPMRHLRLQAGGASSTFPIEPYHSLDRGRLDLVLAQGAVDHGAVFFDDVRATIQSDDRVLLERNGHDVQCAPGIVVVADGLAGTSLRLREDFTWMINHQSPIGLGAVIDCPLNTEDDDSIVMRCAKTGYVGTSRLADGRLVIAAAVSAEAIKEKGSQEAVTRICREAGDDPARFQNIQWKGVGQLTRQRARFAQGRILVLGDAARYVEPLTGEGMSWGICRAANILPHARRILAGEDVGARWTLEANRMLRHRRLVCRTICGLSRRPRALSLILSVLGERPPVGWATRRLCWSSS